MTQCSARSTNSGPRGTIPFVRQWLDQRQTWAEELGRSLLFWYRQTYNLPRNDPRLEDLTPETLWVEWQAHTIYHTPPPEPETMEDAWLEAIRTEQVDPNDRDAQAAFVAQWQAQHPASDDWEAVNEPPPEGGLSDDGGP